MAERGALLTLGLVFLLHCLRNSSACHHNETVNRQRLNALSTYEFFRDSSASEEVKKAVLTEALKAIFTPIDTGFIKGSSETNLTTQVFEHIAKGVESSKGS